MNTRNFITGPQLLEEVERIKAINPDFEHGLTLKPESIAKLGRIETILLIGSSATGKTTLLQMLSEVSEESGLLGPAIEHPRRRITRNKRLNEVDTENHHVSDQEFDQAVVKGDINVWWSRNLDGVGQTRYGFEPRKSSGLAIYSGNNAIMESEEPNVTKLVASSLVMQVYAPSLVRGRRIEERSPDLSGRETEARLSDEGVKLLEDERVHIAISNYGIYDDFALDSLVSIIRALNPSEMDERQR